MRKQNVYNLEFPCYCNKIKIGKYVFKRIFNYEERLKSLQHWVGEISEYSIDGNTGTHSITAFVEIPLKEEKAVLPWDKKNNPTALNDILLLLSIFTGRDVFLDEPCVKPNVIGADPRVYAWGNALICSIPYKDKKNWSTPRL